VIGVWWKSITVLGVAWVSVYQAPIPVTVSWLFDPVTHVGATWELERNGAIQPCTQPQVVGTEGRCSASAPLGSATFRLRGTKTTSDGTAVGGWSVSVTQTVGVPGLLTILSYQESAPPPPSQIVATPASITWTVPQGSVPFSTSITVTTSTKGSWQTFDTSPFYDASAACAFSLCASGTTTTLVPVSAFIKTAAKGTYTHPLTIRSAGLPDKVVPVSLVVQ